MCEGAGAEGQKTRREGTWAEGLTLRPHPVSPQPPSLRPETLTHLDWPPAFTLVSMSIEGGMSPSATPGPGH